ncbi:P-loop containing nucleoside triphosphate hydrolase protein [Triangularia verruculosa]|uniref:P-loop containing nucleoside triphosphate hydrolase protein n=1 Tax=Triangularia verruculosa TaxID=2587418 RepID=A0AAN7AMI0_9PEZI|nr:P-loop containing nucleoside triphosphate hydrolase protein [Triangularia verruculosa]
MSTDKIQNDEESYSIIERLADAIRIEDQVDAEDRQRLVQDLYEGPKKCQCCLSWISKMPEDVEDDEDKEDCTYPLIVRRRVLPTMNGSKKRVELHSIEIRHPQVREALFRVFENYDNLVPQVKFLIFKAPFRQFFWRWDEFNKAIDEEKSELVKTILIQLRSLVRADLAEAFAVKDELVSHGIITFKHLWILYSPGSVVYETARYNKQTPLGEFFIVTEVEAPDENPERYQRHPQYLLFCTATSWNGYIFGAMNETLYLPKFRGSRRISDLRVVPAKYLEDGESVKAQCLERGKKYHEFAGVSYKAYLPEGAVAMSESERQQLTNRIMLDARNTTHRRYVRPLTDLDKLQYYTQLITQAPVDAAPPGGHRPLDENPLRPRYRQPVPVHDYGDYEEPYVRPPPRPVVVEDDAMSVVAVGEDDDTKDKKQVLNDLQLLLLGSTMQGYFLKERKWGYFEVDRIVDVEKNTKPFDSLVLPQGYKELILSFVENQLKDGEAFDDVINGKGGGLVMLLAGDPGVGKTMTAESIAEKIHAPLVKMELSELLKDEQDRVPVRHRRDSRSRSPVSNRGEDELTRTFELAAKWGAVLLIDECDMYLEKRSDDSPERNRLVARFLRELEYFPSLLFLTTNRERVLDPAIWSRIHLTINYPALDLSSRLAIWKTFLGMEEGELASAVSDEEFDKLALIETNGRRIKNITKTARMMAKRHGRGINFEDVRNVMRITEGLVI